MVQEKYNDILYANQICVKPINNKSNEQEFFLNTEQMFNAMKLLTHGAFCVYLYLCTLPNETTSFTYELVKKFTGISQSTYHRAVKELKQHNYLAFYNEYAISDSCKFNAQIWRFYQIPEN